MQSHEISKKININRIEDGAERFFWLKALFQWAILAYKVEKIDVVGAINAEQWGLAFSGSQALLRTGICIFLLEKYYEPPRSIHLQLKLLAKIVRNNQSLYQKAYELEFANPKTEDEIKDYAAMCSNFIEEGLNIKQFLHLNGIETDREWEITIRRAIGVAKYLEKHNRHLLYTMDEWNIVRKLREKLKADT